MVFISLVFSIVNLYFSFIIFSYFDLILAFVFFLFSFFVFTVLLDFIKNLSWILSCFQTGNISCILSWRSREFTIQVSRSLIRKKNVKIVSCIGIVSRRIRAGYTIRDVRQHDSSTVILHQNLSVTWPRFADIIN